MKWNFLIVQKDTALVFPLAIKEHVDHFIVREAGIRTAKKLGASANAGFYFQEDKPYGGIAQKAELERIEAFILENGLKGKIYAHHPEMVIELAFKHYTSQVEEVYKKGIRKRSSFLQSFYGVDCPCDRILNYPVLFNEFSNPL